LFVLTLLSMIWAGTTGWSPMIVLEYTYRTQSLMLIRRMFLANAVSGGLFAVSLLAILAAHELGHYFMTLAYRIPSTAPIFIPFPIAPIGTCGAVIVMNGALADRRQMFDIGIAGPLAGLVVIVPVLILGLTTSIAPGFVPEASFQIGQPFLIQWFAHWLQPDLLANAVGATNTTLNPFLMAAWAGLLITGINMVPVSQLDGGHVLFGIFGRHSRWISFLAYGACLAYVIYYRQWVFVLMLAIVALLGVAHPASRQDEESIGIARTLLGMVSLALPILCIPGIPFTLLP
jgi:membrane-associated protease RseP (regulator of RpoE activity)